MSGRSQRVRSGSKRSDVSLTDDQCGEVPKRMAASGIQRTAHYQQPSRRAMSTSYASQKQRSTHKATITKPQKLTETTEEDGIMFTNEITRPAESRPAKTMSASEILASCEETDYRNVYQIDLRASDLTDVPNLEKFLKVRVVDLSSNHIRTITRLECCVELKELKLYDNEIETLEKLDSLTDLIHLQVQHNKLQCIGRGLINCRKLQILRLDWNKLNRIESKEIASLSKLTQLDLSNNKLDNISALNALPNLVDLAVSNNRLRTIELTRCKKIQELDLSGNRFTELNSIIPDSATLLILNVSKNAISKLELSFPLSHLEELYTSHNNIRRIAGIANKFPSLQVLDLSHNQIQNDKELLCLSECEALRELDLTNNPFDLDEQGRVATNPAEIISTLQVLDGMVLKKSNAEFKAPLMRPMSASHVISSRQVQTHIDTLEAELKTLQLSLEDKFRDLRKKVDMLPSQPTSRVSSADRPPTRGSRRSRIMEAKAFASNKYSDQ